MVISEALKEGNIFLVIGSKSNYSSVITTIQQELGKNMNKIGYITVNKPFNTLLQDFAKNNIDKAKFFFVDAITATVQTPPIVNNCIFVTSPTAMTDLSVSFTCLLNEKNCDIVFFDTISTLIVYQDIGSVIKFTHNLITKTRVMNKKVMFLALKEDSETLIKDLNMFVDKIIEI